MKRSHLFFHHIFITSKLLFVCATGGGDWWSWQVSGGVQKVLRRSDGEQREQCSFQEWNATTCSRWKTPGLRDSQEAFLLSPPLNTKIRLVAQVEQSRSPGIKWFFFLCVCVPFSFCVCIWCLIGLMYSTFQWFYLMDRTALEINPEMSRSITHCHRVLLH